MEKTRRVFVLFVAVFFVAAYFFGLQAGLLATVAALSLATLFKATFGGLARLNGYDTGEGTWRPAAFLLAGVAANAILWAFADARVAGALLAVPVVAGAAAFRLARR